MDIQCSFEEFVHAFRIVMPHLKEILNIDMGIHIGDLNGFLEYSEAKGFDLPVKGGNSYPEGDQALTVISSGKQLMSTLPPEVLGIAVKGIATPIYEGNELKGVIGVARSLNEEFQAFLMTQELSESMQQTVQATEEIAKAANVIQETEQKLADEVINVMNQTQEITKILGFIHSIADQTKMLGLNAAIEASRAGDAGRGFGVVAEEIRKLSDESKKTAKQIQDLTQSIMKSVQSASSLSGQTLKATSDQAASTEEILAGIATVSDNTSKLESYLKQL